MQKVNLHTILLCSLVFFIPLFPRILPIIIVLLVVETLLNRKFISPFNSFFVFFSLTLFYLVYIFGLLYTENLPTAFSDLETKASFMLFPLLFFTRREMNSELRLKAIPWLIYGCVAAVLFCYLQATFQLFATKYYIAHGDKELWDFGFSWFFKGRLSPLIHPSYLSMYVIFAMVIVFVLRNQIKLPKWISIFVWVFFPIFIIMLTAKSGLIALFVFGFWVILWFIKVKKAYWQSVLVVFFSCISFYLFLKFEPDFKDRFVEVYESITGTGDPAREGSTSVRMEIWEVTWNLIKKNPLGVGTGDVKAELKQIYLEKGMQKAYENEYNPHNQYLQTTLAVGWIGFISLLLLLITPLVYAFKNKDSLLFVFMILVLLNLLVESMFETQAGVIFIAFTISFLLCTSSKIKN